jgi:hypothetical protein
MKFQNLLKNKSKINLADICEAWQWLIADQKEVLFVTIFGDLFLIGKSNEINWLDTSVGKLTKVANDVDDFKTQLKNADNYDNWFLGWLHDDIEKSGIVLKDNEVLSFKINPILGGEYTFENISPLDISVHFQLSGQICEQTKDLPDGSKIDIVTAK